VSHRTQIASRVVLPLAIAVLPLVLLYSSLRTFHEIDEQRAIYLRHRVGLLAARLENLSGPVSHDELVDMLSQDEPYLVALRVVERGSAGDTADLAPLWDGRELFRTGTVRNRRTTLFRAYIPFHSGEGLRIARIDLDSAAAEFLVVHARHNVIVASVGGLVLVLLSIYSLWAMRRAARFRERQLEMEHLAHIGKMAAVLAHEIRNPLGTIKGFVQLAGERADAATRELLAPALSETQRLEALVSDLLSYGRTPLPQPKPATWEEIASRAAGHARQLIGGRPIRLVVSEAKLQWQTDPDLFGQALLNLARNAIEAIPAADEGEVRIEVRTEGKGGLAITVADSGSGISDDAMARLFEPFFTTKAFGTGLGLAITRKIVASLGGALELRRRAEGGTEAIIRMPKARPIEV
jgi:two-component system sensor histidine kinase HydH